MNPLHLEYKKAQRTTLLLVLLLALSAAAIDYFWTLQQRLSQRQAMLHSATEDLEHQLIPMLELLKFLHQDAEQQLTLATDAHTEQPLVGLSWQVAKTSQGQLSTAEVAMLQQLQPLLQLSQRTVVGVKQLSYLSAAGVWYQPQAQASPSAEQLSKQYWQQYEKQQRLTMPVIALKKINTTPASYLLSIGVFRQQQLIGELLLDVDLPAILHKTAKAQQDAQLQLFDEGGNIVLAVAKGELLATESYDALIHHSDQLKMLSSLPLSLHIALDHHKIFSTEVIDFVVHFFLFLLALLLLLAYCRRRYRVKVLSPFQRLLVHIERLLRGDAQGVRNVPTDWQPLFRQVEQLKPHEADQNKR